MATRSLIVPVVGTLLVLATSTLLPAASISVTATIRDFKDSHPDFEAGVILSDLGIVSTTLGADKKPVYAGSPTTTTTSGATNFDQWYRDVSGVNLTTTKTLEAMETTPGTYKYTSSAFFPIDGELWGNEGRSHNYHFTTEIHTEFTYLGGEKFTFVGDDDVWVFINDELVIDLGGVHGALSKVVLLNDLGLTIGETYDLDLFHAERQTTASTFEFTTSALLVDTPLDPVPEPGSLAMILLGTLGTMFVARGRS